MQIYNVFFGILSMSAFLMVLPIINLAFDVNELLKIMRKRNNDVKQ